MLLPLSAERAGVRGPAPGTPFPLPLRRIYPSSSSQSNALYRGSRILRFTFYPSCSRFTWKVVFQKWVVLENHNRHRRPLAAEELPLCRSSLHTRSWGPARRLVLESREQQTGHPFGHLRGVDWGGRHRQPALLPLASAMVGHPTRQCRGALEALVFP
jgi:hypothetical protein